MTASPKQLETVLRVEFCLDFLAVLCFGFVFISLIYHFYFKKNSKASRINKFIRYTVLIYSSLYFVSFIIGITMNIDTYSEFVEDDNLNYLNSKQYEIIYITNNTIWSLARISFFVLWLGRHYFSFKNSIYQTKIHIYIILMIFITSMFLILMFINIIVFALGTIELDDNVLLILVCIFGILEFIVASSIIILFVHKLFTLILDTTKYQEIIDNHERSQAMNPSPNNERLDSMLITDIQPHSQQQSVMGTPGYSTTTPMVGTPGKLTLGPLSPMTRTGEHTMNTMTPQGSFIDPNFNNSTPSMVALNHGRSTMSVSMAPINIGVNDDNPGSSDIDPMLNQSLSPPRSPNNIPRAYRQMTMSTMNLFKRWQNIDDEGQTAFNVRLEPKQLILINTIVQHSILGSIALISAQIYLLMFMIYQFDFDIYKSDFMANLMLSVYRPCDRIIQLICIYISLNFTHKWYKIFCKKCHNKCKKCCENIAKSKIEKKLIEKRKDSHYQLMLNVE